MKIIVTLFMCLIVTIECLHNKNDYHLEQGIPQQFYKPIGKDLSKRLHIISL